MDNVNDLLDAAKESAGSDNGIAKAVGVPRQRVWGWRNHHSKPQSGHLLKIARLAEVSFEDAVMAIELDPDFYGDSEGIWIERYLELYGTYPPNYKTPSKQAGYTTVGNVILLGGLSLATVTQSPGIALLTGIGGTLHCILC